MNKQELIKSYEDCRFGMILVDRVLEDLRQLDESQKVTVPQFVADYIKYAIENDWDFQDLFKRIEDEEDEKLLRWVYHERNQETLATAWINGYEVEKEKRYYIRFKFIEDSYSYLTLIKHLNTWTLTEIKIDKKFRTEHTKKQLEQAGFGWVFDCPGIEIEEAAE